MKMNNLVKRTKEPYDPSIECDKCGSEIDFEKLLCKYDQKVYTI
jgi:hypothetical protein